MLAECAEKEWDRHQPGREACEPAPYREEEESHDEIKKNAMEGNENADELANEGAGLDGRVMAAAKRFNHETKKELQICVRLFMCMSKIWKT